MDKLAAWSKGRNVSAVEPRLFFLQHDPAVRFKEGSDIGEELAMQVPRTANYSLRLSVMTWRAARAAVKWPPFMVYLPERIGELLCAR